MVDGKKVKAQIWDTAGQERYRAITSAYYRGAAGAVLVYDIAKHITYDNIGRWMQEINDHGERNITMMLVGNKCDLKHLRAVPVDEAKVFAEKSKMFFIETSALDSTNVDEAFNYILKAIFRVAQQQKLVDDGASENCLSHDMSRVMIPEVEEEGEGEKKTGCCYSG